MRMWDGAFYTLSSLNINQSAVSVDLLMHRTKFGQIHTFVPKIPSADLDGGEFVFI